MKNASPDVPLITVIVPVYNSEKYLSQCIESILNQTFTQFELLLINDGSTDKSPEICQAYANRDSRVHVLTQKNQGVSAARNRGLKEAQGSYLTFVDSDDYIDDVLLERAYNAILETDADLYMSGLVTEFFSDDKIIVKKIMSANGSKQYFIKDLLDDIDIFYPISYLFGPCCKLWKRQILENGCIRYQEDMDFIEDFMFNIETISWVKKVILSDEICYHYRKESKDSLSSKFHPKYYEQYTYTYDCFRNMLQKYGCLSRTKKHFEGIYFSGLVSAIAESFLDPNAPKQAQKEIIDKVAKNIYISKMKLWETKDITTYKQKIIFIMIKLKLTAPLFYLLKFYAKCCS